MSISKKLCSGPDWLTIVRRLKKEADDVVYLVSFPRWLSILLLLIVVSYIKLISDIPLFSGKKGIDA